MNQGIKNGLGFLLVVLCGFVGYAWLFPNGIGSQENGRLVVPPLPTWANSLPGLPELAEIPAPSIPAIPDPPKISTPKVPTIPSPPNPPIPKPTIQELPFNPSEVLESEASKRQKEQKELTRKLKEGNRKAVDRIKSPFGG